MNVNFKLSGATFKASVQHMLRRFHVLIFILVVVGGLGSFILLLGQIMKTSSDTSGYVSPNSNTTFDKDTIKRINALGDASVDDTIIDSREAKGLRINPFVE